MPTSSSSSKKKRRTFRELEANVKGAKAKGRNKNKFFNIARSKIELGVKFFVLLFFLLACVFLGNPDFDTLLHHKVCTFTCQVAAPGRRERNPLRCLSFCGTCLLPPPHGPFGTRASPEKVPPEAAKKVY